MFAPVQKAAEISLSYQPKKCNHPSISNSSEAFDVLWEHYNKATIALQEEFLVLLLNRANKVLGVYRQSIGGIQGTVVDNRLLLTVALLAGATQVIISHNHPSGSLMPSQQDRSLTQKLITAADILDIHLLDHLIVSPERNFLSMKEKAFM